MTITITIKTDNEAFANGNRETEIARIMQVLAMRASDGGTHYLPGNVRDINGNTVGTVKVTGR